MSTETQAVLGLLLAIPEAEQEYVIGETQNGAVATASSPAHELPTE